MKVSAKAEYAALAMLDLAIRHAAAEPVRVRDIVERHGIPSRFLVQILLQLKGAGLVVSTRGASGGYQLARPPEEISLGDVITVIDGPITAGPSSAPGSPASRLLNEVWREITDIQTQRLGEVSFAELLERAQQSEEMYYI